VSECRWEKKKTLQVKNTSQAYSDAWVCPTIEDASDGSAHAVLNLLGAPAGQVYLRTLNLFFLSAPAPAPATPRLVTPLAVVGPHHAGTAHYRRYLLADIEILSRDLSVPNSLFGQT
jgi:hypothetical protein